MRDGSGTSGTLLLWNVSVVDGTSAAVQSGMAVRVSGGRVAAVEPTGGGDPPAEAIDLSGRYVLPGLIDAHFHLADVTNLFSEGFGMPEPLEGEMERPPEMAYFLYVRAAGELLSAGITSLRDVGCYNDDAILLGEAIRLGLVEGPHILSCGRILSATSPGGRMFGTMYEEADGPWEMRKCVRNQVRRGADYIKIMAGGARSVLWEDPEPAQLTVEEMSAAVDEAHRLGLRVAAHAEGLGGARLAVECKVDTVEHGLSLHRAPELLAAMAEQGAVLVPTLTTFHDIAERFAGEFSPALVDQAKRQQEEAHRTLLAAREAGVTLAMGFDSGPPGANAKEAVRMVEGGLSPAEAITAATRGSAAALGLEDRGTMSVGAVADLIVLAGNPLTDIDVLTRSEAVSLVVREGRIVAGRLTHQP